ncbi:MAG: RNA polymerase sigma factor [Ignavibacteriales bacterium]|nr:MAG: RNA polymerase sigma factor [Ignavibacteriales bacterium]
MLETLGYKVLVNRFKNRIYSYALYMVKNQMDAEDISQEVLIRIWKNMGKFKLPAAGSWIMRTTHNLCIDYLRKEQVVKQRSYYIDEGFEEKIIDEDKLNQPEVITLQSITNEKIKSAIKKLPETLKSVFVLYQIEGFKYKEISEVLDLPINSVKVYILRARKKLQEELKSYAGYEA